MASFRNSTLPEWAANESDGYFRRRSSTGVENQSGSQPFNQPSNNASSPFIRKRGECLPKDTLTAASVVIGNRMWMTMKNAFFCLMLLLTILFTVIPVNKRDFDESTSFMGKVGFYGFVALICRPGIVFTVILYFTLNMFAVLLTTTGSSKYGLNIQLQLNRCISTRFLIKPLLLIIFANMTFFYLLEMFDDCQLYLLRSKLSDGCGKSDSCYFLEDRLVIRISISVAALDFFITSYMNGLFVLEFPSVPIKRQWVALFDPREIAESVRRSFLVALPTGVLCFLIGPMFYCVIFRPFGILIWEDQLLGRIFLFLNIGFIVRLFLYTAVTRSVLPLLLKLVNYRFTDTVNFHLEETTGHQQCLLLSEAMSGESNYLKKLAFYEFNCKGDSGNSEIGVFFEITHPGNHPHNWRNLFRASVKVVKGMNEGIVNFLKAAKMPPNFFQSGLGPYILNQLRERQTVEQQNVSPVAPVELPRGVNMRDLTSSSRPDFPNQIPTITEVVQQNLELIWNDMKAAVLGFFTMQTINNLVFGGKLDVKIEENIIANMVSDHLLSYWAINGTQKLMCLSVSVDNRGVVNQDIKPFFVTVLETYDVFTALDIYMTKSLDDQPNVNRKVLDKNKEIVSKMINTCVFVLAKLQVTFSSCYPILGIDRELQNRIVDIITNRERP